MNLVPKIINRSRGDYLSSEDFNNNNQDLYGDVVTLLDRELELYGKSKLTSEVLEATNIGYKKALGDVRVHPKINIGSEFVFPDAGPNCILDKVFEEITLPVESKENQLLTDAGKVRDIINVRRTSDNFLFSTNPESVSESRILDSIEDSNYPYVVRVRGVNDTVKIKIILETQFGSMGCNSMEFVPAPYVGSTALEYLSVQEADGNITLPLDPAGNQISMRSVPVEERYRPIRFHTILRERIGIHVGYEGLNKLESSNISLAGLYKFRVEKRSWQTKGYIGFMIPAEPGRILKTIKPVVKWNNTYIGETNFKLYRTLESLKSLDTNVIGSFNSTGDGTAVSLDSDIWVLVEMQSRINASPQLFGFDYETIG
jgi:hypothetical protein